MDKAKHAADRLQHYVAIYDPDSINASEYLLKIFYYAGVLAGAVKSD